MPPQNSSPSKKGGTNAGLALASLAVFAAFTVRVFWLGKQELGFDEAVSAFIATKSIAEIISYIQGQLFEHPPLYYFLLHGWIQLTGTTEFALRYFSILFGVVLVALTWVLVKPFAHRLLSPSAIFITAIFPFQIVQAQEARMYTFLACLGALSIIFLYRAFAMARSRWWIAYGLTIVMGMGTHYYFALLPLAHSAYVLLYYRNSIRALKGWALTMAVLSIPPLAWLLLSPGPRNAIAQSFTNWSLAQANAEDLRKLGVETVFGNMGLASLPFSEHLGAALVLALATIGILNGESALSNRRRSGSPFGVSLHRVLAVSVLGPLLLSFLLPHNLIARYVSFSTAPFYVLIGFGIAAVGGRLRFLSIAALTLVAAISILGVRSHFADTDKGGFGAAARMIQDARLPGDAVVLTHPHQWLYVAYYLPSDLPVYYVPAVPSPPADDEVEVAMKAITAKHERVWLGPTGPWNMDPQSKVESWLLKNSYRASKRWVAGSMAVSLFYNADLEMGARSVQYRVGPDLYLRSFAVSDGFASPSDAVRVRLSWQPASGSPQELLIGLRLIDEAGRVWSDTNDLLMLAGQPSQAEGQLASSLHALIIPPGTPPGTYRLELSLFSPSRQENLAFADGLTGQVRGAALPLQEVKVSRPSRPTPISARPFSPSGTFGEKIELLGADFIANKYLQGDKISLAIAWRTNQDPKRDYVVLIELVDSAGRVSSETRLPLGPQTYPSSQWQEGDYVKAHYQVPIPGTLPPGQYDVRVALQDPSTSAFLPVKGERWNEGLWGLWRRREAIDGTDIPLHRLPIAARQRAFTAPTIAHPEDENMGGQLRFAGYGSLPTQISVGRDLPLTLYWQATKNIDTSYTVFIHLLNDTGQVAAQHDIVPRNGTYPTDLWIEGEFIEDVHLVPLPANLPEGHYLVEIGMYDAKTMERLPVIGRDSQVKDDRILLPPVNISRTGQ